MFVLKGISRGHTCQNLEQSLISSDLSWMKLIFVKTIYNLNAKPHILALCVTHQINRRALLAPEL